MIDTRFLAELMGHHKNGRQKERTNNKQSQSKTKTLFRPWSHVQFLIFARRRFGIMGIREASAAAADIVMVIGVILGAPADSPALTVVAGGPRRVTVVVMMHHLRSLEMRKAIGVRWYSSSLSAGQGDSEVLITGLQRLIFPLLRQLMGPHASRLTQVLRIFSSK